MSPEELLNRIDEMIEKTGASSPGEIGKVIGPLMKELAGKVDGNEVKKLILQKLGG
jgi:hypothetical protein